MGYIKLPLGLCMQCNDDKLRPIIGKREKALCVPHYQVEHRRSAQGKKDDIIYTGLKKKYIADHPYCEIGIEGICTGKAKDIHHTKGRGIYYLVVEFFKATCRACHNHIGDNTDFAYQQGHSVKRQTK
jgi:hypothetical protein